MIKLIKESDIRIDIEGAKEIMKKGIDEFYREKEIKRKNYQKIEIKTCKDSPVLSEVAIGGQKISGVRSYELIHKAGDMPRLKLDINVLNLEVDGMCLCTAEGWGDFAMRMIDPYSEEMEQEGE